MKDYTELHFPKTRIATFDVYEIGRKRHHISALLELDVTNARIAIKEFRAKTKKKLSFTAWLLINRLQPVQTRFLGVQF